MHVGKSFLRVALLDDYVHRYFKYITVSLAWCAALQFSIENYDTASKNDKGTRDLTWVAKT